MTKHRDVREAVTLILARAGSNRDVWEKLKAVNWGYLRVSSVLRTEDEEGRLGWLVYVEEASSPELEAYIREQLTIPDVEIVTEW